MSWMWPLFGVIFIICGLFCTNPAIPRALHVAWRVGLSVALAILLALEGLVISGMNSTAPPGMDALIVLGARVDPDGPSPALNRRLNAVIAHIGEHPRAIIIATGGQGADEPMSEAQCIRDELVRRGVDSSRIRMEDRSTSTMENIENAMALLESPEDSVGLITNNYHVWRAVHIAQKAGLQNVYGIAAEYTGYTKLHYMIRETICIAVDWIRGNL